MTAATVGLKLRPAAASEESMTQFAIFGFGRLWRFVLSGARPLRADRAARPEHAARPRPERDHVFQVEIAATPPTREVGLMNRRFMPTDRGMLFEFEREEPVAFWMKNTYIPLDMIFISRSGMVTRIVERAEPLPRRSFPRAARALAVLELNGGVAAAIGTEAGDRSRHPFFKP